MCSFMSLVNWFKPNQKKASAISAKEQTAQICAWRMTHRVTWAHQLHTGGVSINIQFVTRTVWVSHVVIALLWPFPGQPGPALCVCTRLEVGQAGLGHAVTSMSCA